ncbi:MAG: PPC domain-containing protein [bacterium]|nr:PPC domain-containing protein [bacterium]
MKGLRVNFFHKLAVRVLVVTSIAGLSAAAVSAQKEQAPEPTSDSSILSLPILLSGDALDFSFEDTDGAFLAAFNASEGDVVDISMAASASELDPYLVVFGSDGTLLAQDDDSGEQPLDSFVDDFEVPADGTYFILATSFTYRNSAITEGAEDLTFTLSVDGNTQPADIAEDSFSYFVVTAAVGESFEIPFSADDGNAYFVTFDGEAGQSVDINAPSDELDTLMMLFDFNGRRIAVDDDGGDAPLAANIAAELPEDGLYFLILTTYDYASVASGSTVPEGVVNFSIE